MSVRRALCSRSLAAYWLLIAFALRALLPQGFMPDAEPFTLKLCPAGLPAQVLTTPVDPHAAHHAHAHSGHSEEHRSHHQSADQCPFGAASAAFGLAQCTGVTVAWLGSVELAVPTTVPDSRPRPVYWPQPRGPPA